MAELTFDEILQAAQKLTREQKALLAQSLNPPPETEGLTREKVLAEFKRRKAAGMFKNAKSLRNKYYNPALDDLTDEQLLADIHEIATEWEKELDEFFGDEG
jgi:hypothetical protein